MSLQERFPTDETTLTLLYAACEINPDSGHTELNAFLDMGSRVKSETDISDEFVEDGAPVFFVEYEEGFEPWDEYSVIQSLIEEIRELRANLKAKERA